MEKCPHCNELLGNDSIGFFQSGDMIYYVFLNNGELVYEQDEFDSKDNFGFFCRNCGHELRLTEDEVKAILSEESNTILKK